MDPTVLASIAGGGVLVLLIAVLLVVRSRQQTGGDSEDYVELMALLTADPIDWEKIEGGRDRVKPEMLESFIRDYSSLPSWHSKAALIQLLQDRMEPRLHPIMKDFLCAPAEPQHDLIHGSKVVALLHLEGSFDNFSKWWGDPQAVEQRASELGEG